MVRERRKIYTPLLIGKDQIRAWFEKDIALRVRHIVGTRMRREVLFGWDVTGGRYINGYALHIRIPRKFFWTQQVACPIVTLHGLDSSDFQMRGVLRCSLSNVSDHEIHRITPLLERFGKDCGVTILIAVAHYKASAYKSV